MLVLLLGFDEARFADFFAELLAWVFPFAFPLPRAASFFRAVFFLAAIGRLVPPIRFCLPTELAGKTVPERLSLQYAEIT